MGKGGEVLSPRSSGASCPHSSRSSSEWPGGVVGEREAPGGGMRIGYPIFGNDIQAGEGAEIEQEVVGVETTQAGRLEKVGRVGNRLGTQAEARKEPHEAGAQAVGGVQGQGGRVAAAGFELPDLVVDVIGGTQAEIGCQGESQRVARSEIPIAHGYSIRGFGSKVKGFVLESFTS